MAANLLRQRMTLTHPMSPLHGGGTMVSLRGFRESVQNFPVPGMFSRSWVKDCA